MTDPDFIQPDAYAGRVLPAETERAWAAGFFDGEGWFGATSTTGRNKGRYLRMAVVQTETTTLERFRDAICGVGRIYERSKNQPTNWANGWCLQVNALGDVTCAVNMIWPYLSQPKRSQISAAYAIRADYRATWRSDFPLPQQRLSDDDLIQIKALLAEGQLTQVEIGKQFGVTSWHISKIKHGRRGTRAGS